MMKGRKRMNHGATVLLALTAAVATGCATAGAGGPGAERPRDDSDTRAASVYLAQAALAEGEAARSHYEQALVSAHSALERDPNNPRAYLIAGQAAVGTGDWVQADTMFARAEELHPAFTDQIAAEREEGWVMAYNVGAEALNEGDYSGAIEGFRGADLLFQGRPEARMALGMLYAREGDTEAAIEAYRGMLDILAQPPPVDLPEEQLEAWEQDRQSGTFNLANLLAQAGRYGEAADQLTQFLEESPASMDQSTRRQAMTARATFLGQAGRGEEAEELYEELMAQEDLGTSEYFQIGIGLFNSGEYERAAEAFATAARMNPHSRDAHLNLVQSLYTAALDLEEEPQTPERDARLRDMYEDLLAAADRVSELDPLNRNLLSFTLRAYRAKADLSDAAEADRLLRRSQDVFRAYQEQPFEVSDIMIAFGVDDQAVIEGVVTNLTAAAGEEVALQFTIVDMDGNVLDTATARATLAAAEESTQFSTEVDLSGGEMAGWRYEVVP